MLGVEHYPDKRVALNLLLLVVVAISFMQGCNPADERSVVQRRPLPADALIVYERRDLTTGDFWRYKIEEPNDVEEVRELITSVMEQHEPLPENEGVSSSDNHRLRFTEPSGRMLFSVSILGDSILYVDGQRFPRADALRETLDDMVDGMDGVNLGNRG